MASEKSNELEVGTHKGLPIMLFDDAGEWEIWLEKNQDSSNGLWLQIAKKGSAVSSVNYEEALDVALCYGWIDGQKASFDDSVWLQKFSPRGRNSIWSKRNRERAELLSENGHMQPRGSVAVEQAKANGNWDRAYASQREMEVPADFRQALNANVAARAFFETLKGANRYALLFRIQTAKKPETRARRISEFIDMLTRHETFH